MTEQVYVIIGVGRWPEDGFEVGLAFEDKEAAEAKIEEKPDEGMDYGGWDTYYAKDVELRD